MITLVSAAFYESYIKNLLKVRVPNILFFQFYFRRDISVHMYIDIEKVRYNIQHVLLVQ